MWFVILVISSAQTYLDFWQTLLPIIISSKWLRGEWLDRFRCFSGWQPWLYITVPCSWGRTSRRCAIPLVSRWSYINCDISVIVHCFVHVVSNASYACECSFPKQSATLKSDSIFDWLVCHKLLLWTGEQHITTALTSLTYYVVRHPGDFMRWHIPWFMIDSVTHHISSKWLRREWLDRCRCFSRQQRRLYITALCSSERASGSCANPFVSRWSSMNGHLSVTVHCLFHIVSNVSFLCECLFQKQPVTSKSESMFDSDMSSTKLLPLSDTKHITRALTSLTGHVVHNLGDLMRRHIPRFLTNTVTHHILSRWLCGEWLNRCWCCSSKQRWFHATLRCIWIWTSAGCAIPFVSRWSCANGDISVIVHCLFSVVSNVSLMWECLFPKHYATSKWENMF